MTSPVVSAFTTRLMMNLIGIDTVAMSGEVKAVTGWICARARYEHVRIAKFSSVPLGTFSTTRVLIG
jgi:hypothetical protein